MSSTPTHALWSLLSPPSFAVGLALVFAVALVHAHLLTSPATRVQRTTAGLVRRLTDTLARLMPMLPVPLKPRRNPRGLPLPPGPKGLPLLGNAADVPREAGWEAYHALCETYGDMVYLNALGQGILVLDSRRCAIDLLEKRAANYSDRPRGVVIDLLDLEWNFVLMQYGARWRRYRRTFHRYHHPNAVRAFHPVMYEERARLLANLTDTPDDFLRHIEAFLGGIIMRATYGIDDRATNASLIKLGDTVTDALAEATHPGRFLVGVLPILRHVPEWFPGAARWKRWFREAAGASRQMLNSGFDIAKTELLGGRRSVHPSMAADLLDRMSGEGVSPSEKIDQEQVAKGVCALSYVGGAETSIASAMGLVLALANNPEVQRKAQAELDAVVGCGRLPLLTDRPTLPYVHAIVKELGRWYTVAPLSSTHAATEDDEYQGYFIPKGTIVIANSWAMLHDPTVFENPFDFSPERYLDVNGRLDLSVPDAEMAGFGFGRRICPGRHFGKDTIFLLAASILARFNIAQPKDKDGNRIPLELVLRQALIAKPTPFKCEVAPRDLV